MNENELIRKVAAKDLSAFKELVERYQALVLRICIHLLGSHEEAEEVAQDIFFQIYKSAGNFRHQSKLSTWIYRIAVNVSLNFIRDNKDFRWLKSLDSLLEKEPQQAAPHLLLNSKSPEILLQEKERKKLIQQALASLPEKQKIAFVLNKIEGLSSQEIADVLEVTLSSVEARLHRAKANLQKKLIPLLKKM
ncbi:MAG: sigma-70 family RNA polymerase sigma factor [Candidatus Aminicenantales bacterium]